MHLSVFTTFSSKFWVFPPICLTSLRQCLHPVQKDSVRLTLLIEDVVRRVLLAADVDRRLLLAEDADRRALLPEVALR